eukprot:9660309-Lingulodinium_polyedra.AAC.1
MAAPPARCAVPSSASPSKRLPRAWRPRRPRWPAPPASSGACWSRRRSPAECGPSTRRYCPPRCGTPRSPA